MYVSLNPIVCSHTHSGNLAPEQLNRTLIQTIHSLTAANKWFHQQVELYAKQN